MHQAVEVRVITNSITYSRIINVDSGKITTQPINTNGNISLNFWSGFGFKLKKSGIGINLNPQAGYNKYADIVNGSKSFSKNLNTGVSVYFSKSKEKKYDISLENEFNYNSNTTSQNNTKIHYNTNRLSFNGTIYIKKVWSIINDYQYYFRQKSLQFDNSLNNQIWNSKLQRTFKKDEFTVYFMVRDILNQNIGIERNFYSNTYTEVKNERLKRYFLVGFTWDFKNKGAANK